MELQARYFAEGLPDYALESADEFAKRIKAVEETYPDGVWSWDPWSAREEELAKRKGF